MYVSPGLINYMSVGNDAAVFVKGEVVVVEDEVARIRLPPKQVHALKADLHRLIRCTLQIRCTYTNCRVMCRVGSSADSKSRTFRSCSSGASIA